MQFLPIKTRRFLPPKDDIYDLLNSFLPPLRSGDILIITSKVLGIHQGRCVKIEKDTLEERNKLIMQEADWYIPPQKRKGMHWHLTIKDYTLIADAGIDRSNGLGYYILWPKNTKKLIREIRRFLKKKYHLKKLGIIVVDSHLVPQRAGTMGISTAFFGFEPLIDYRGTPDIFGRKLKYTRANIVDPLAAISSLLIGEGNEQTPMLLIRGLKFIKFTDRDTSQKLVYPPHMDIYRPLLRVYRRNKKLTNRNNAVKY